MIIQRVLAIQTFYPVIQLIFIYNIDVYVAIFIFHYFSRNV